MTGKTQKAPPTSLGKAGKKLWLETVDAVVDEPHILAMLLSYCQQADVIVEAEKVLKTQGRYYQAGDLIRVHPAEQTVIASHRVMQTYARQLGISRTNIRVTEKEKRQAGAKKVLDGNVFKMQAVPNKKR